MASNAKIKASPRNEYGKSATRKMRAAGRIPGVVYGHGEQTRAVSLDAHELGLLFGRVHWENTIIELDIEGERSGIRTLVREVQSHAFKPLIVHVDFQQIHAGELLHVSVPIRLIGTAVGTRSGGVLMQNETDLSIHTTPDKIPDFLEVDISGLDIGDSIHLRDITLPEGVEADIDADRTICTVTPPTVAPVEPTAEATAETEVIRRVADEEA